MKKRLSNKIDPPAVNIISETIDPNKLLRLRLELENIILFLDRPTPNCTAAREIAEEQLAKFGGKYRK